MMVGARERIRYYWEEGYEMRGRVSVTKEVCQGSRINNKIGRKVIRASDYLRCKGM